MTADGCALLRCGRAAAAQLLQALGELAHVRVLLAARQSDPRERFLDERQRLLQRARVGAVAIERGQLYG